MDLLEEENRKQIMRQKRNKTWYNERGRIQSKIRSILKSKKYNIDVNECFYAFETAYKPTDELKDILNRLHHHIFFKELYQ